MVMGTILSFLIGSPTSKQANKQHSSQMKPDLGIILLDPTDYLLVFYFKSQITVSIATST